MLTPRTVACLGLLALSPFTQAQTPPSAYTITQNGNSPGTAITLYRNGSKALTIVNEPAQGSKPAMRLYSLYDIAAGINYSWIPDSPPIQCSTGTFSGDWVDPFAMTAEITKNIASGDVKPAGSETINGIPTQVYAGSNAKATEKVWFDQKDGLVIRAQVTGPGAPLVTLVDITKVLLAAPDPSCSSSCRQLALAKSHRGPPPNSLPMKPVTTQPNFVNGIYGPGSGTELLLYRCPHRRRQDHDPYRPQVPGSYRHHLRPKQSDSTAL